MRRKFLFLIVAMVIIASLCVFAACNSVDTSGKDGGTGGIRRGTTEKRISCLTAYMTE